MKVIDPGHVYDLQWLDGEPFLVNIVEADPPNRLTFVKREGEGYPGNVGNHPGTTMQEVLRVCIDRLTYLDNQKAHDYNERVVDHLRAAIFWLEMRAAERHGRDFSNQDYRRIELEPTCPKCLHIGCPGTCH